ncbi:MAG: glycoside hydrolase family 43 protein, partial [Armatimonadetes bacterium]|nr:glycoside hydrolase family 43 protein [Armatimonadota bacterium]
LRSTAVLMALASVFGVSAPSTPAYGAAQPLTGQRQAVRTYTNPVYEHDFPDPFILPYRGKYYAYATHGRGHGFQVMESPDLVHWTHKGTAFEVPWSRVHWWAPEVFHYRNRFYMTYSAQHPETKKHDIGIATADSPLGPFTHRAILVRAEENRTGVIDATIFFEPDGTPYLVYSEENPRRIVLRKMARDLLSVVEEKSTVLLVPDRPEERGVVEAPTLIRRDGKYHLFYSTGWFQSNIPDASYAVYHAVAPSVRGPYVKDPKPILQSVPGLVYGPGHQGIVQLPCGEWWMAYHGWDNRNEPRYGSNPVGRTLRIDRMRWVGGTPVMDGPTVTPQPVPCLDTVRYENGPHRRGWSPFETIPIFGRS